MMAMNSYSEGFYTKLPGGPITQGDVWSALPSALSPDIHSLGVIITPRCDLAHDKAEFINYLPILPLQDYIARQGGFELLEQEKANVNDTATRLARDLGIDRLIIAGVPLSEALEIAERNCGPETWNTHKIQSKITELRNVTGKSDSLSNHLRLNFLEVNVINQLLNGKTLTRYKNQIVRNAIADLHFLPPCPPLIIHPAVVLLRCIGTTKKLVFSTALRCVTPDEWARKAAECAPLVNGDFYEKPERLVRVRSPYLEALMARFGSLYSRVGTRDLPEDAINSMMSEL